MIETLVQSELLFDDRHEKVNREGNPHLRLHGVGGGAVESLDVEVLLDTAEEQFDPDHNEGRDKTPPGREESDTHVDERLWNKQPAPVLRGSTGQPAPIMAG